MKPRRPPCAIVTGGAGFIGSRIAETLLADGFRVYVVDDLSSGQLENVPARAEFVDLSVACATELSTLFRQTQPALVSHHAAQASVINSLDNPQADLLTNYHGLLNVLEASRLTDVPQFVFASSCAVYGNVSGAADENHPTVPVSPYGISKLAGERYVRYFSDRGHVRATILRYGNVYGPLQRPSSRSGVVSIFADRLLQKQSVVLFGDGSSVRDYVFIDDVVRAHQLAIQSPRGSHDIFNVGTGIGTCLLELLREVSECVSGMPLEPSLLDFREDRFGETSRSVLHSVRAQKAFGWTPRVSLAEGIRRVVAWLRESDRTNSTPVGASEPVAIL